MCYSKKNKIKFKNTNSSATLVRLLRLGERAPVKEFRSKRLSKYVYLLKDSHSSHEIWPPVQLLLGDTYTTSNVFTSPRVEGMLPVSLLLSKSLTNGKISLLERKQSALVASSNITSVKVWLLMKLEILTK